MRTELKNLIASIRRNYPIEACDGIISGTFVLESGETYQIQIDGTPPTDEVKIYRGEDVIFEARNWGAQEIAGVTKLPVGAFVDDIESTAVRRAIAKKGMTEPLGRPKKKDS